MTQTVESQQTWTRHPAHCGRSGLFSSLLSAIFTWVLHKTLIIVRTPSTRLKRSVNQHLLLRRARVDEKALSFMAHKLSFRASALSYWSEKDKHTPPFAVIHNLSIHWSEENPSVTPSVTCTSEMNFDLQHIHTQCFYSQRWSHSQHEHSG